MRQVIKRVKRFKNGKVKEGIGFALSFSSLDTGI